MAARIRSEQSLKNKIIDRYGDSPILHDVFVWLPQGKCHVDLFVPLDADINSPAAHDLRDGVLALISAGENREGRNLSVDVDSHQRVVRKFNGSYYNRFR